MNPLAGFLLGGVYATALVRDRMRDDKARFELMWNAPPPVRHWPAGCSTDTGWDDLYAQGELRQQRDEACS